MAAWKSGSVIPYAFIMSKDSPIYFLIAHYLQHPREMGMLHILYQRWSLKEPNCSELHIKAKQITLGQTITLFAIMVAAFLVSSMVALAELIISTRQKKETPKETLETAEVIPGLYLTLYEVKNMITKLQENKPYLSDEIILHEVVGLFQNAILIVKQQIKNLD